MSVCDFLICIGLFMLNSTYLGHRRSAFLKKLSIQFNEYMSQTRFEKIISSWAYTKENLPQYVDKFWEIHELIKAFNTYMEKNCFVHGCAVWMNLCLFRYHIQRATNIT